MHERTTMRLDRDPAFTVERDDGLTHGDATDTEFLGDVVLPDVVALLQFAVENQRTDVARDLVTAAPAVDDAAACGGPLVRGRADARRGSAVRRYDLPP
nr:hypothetical protein [Micromonospora sp. DSM 115978]